MRFLNSKYDLPVQEEFMWNLFCMGGGPSVYHTCYTPSNFSFWDEMSLDFEKSS